MAATNTYHNILKAGTQAAYEAIATKDANVLYFCTDTKKIYKGTVDFTESVILAASKPATPVAGKVYIFTDTKTVEAYVGGAWKVISYEHVTSVDAKSTDAQVASAKAVYDYVEAAIAEIATSDSVVSTIELKKDSEGAVIEGTLKITMADGTTTSDLALTGVATTPTWDSDSRKLVIPIVGKDDLEVEIGKDMVVESGYYDSATQSIVLVLANDAGTIVIPVADLIDEIKTADTDSVSLTYDKSTNTISADINISTKENNALTVVSEEGKEGLFLSLAAYYTAAEVDAAIAPVSATATAADTLSKANKGRLDVLEGDAETAGSVANAIATQASAQKAIDDAQDGKIEALETNLGTTNDNLAALATATTAWGTF